MQDSTFIGLDVHKATISVAVAEGVRGGEVRHLGTIPHRADHVRKLVEKLGSGGRNLHFCYEAGPCGYGLPSIMGAKIGQPDVPVVGFAGDGAFGISMNEMSAIGRKEWPPITMIIFRNYQWGAEKRNTTLWFEDNFVGTELDQQVSYAGIARACGVEGVAVYGMDELRDELAKAVDAQMNNGVTTFIEVMLNQELGEPFRRDAMKKPVSVAGINREDMRPQSAA